MYGYFFRIWVKTRLTFSKFINNPIFFPVKSKCLTSFNPNSTIDVGCKKSNKRQDTCYTQNILIHKNFIIHKFFLSLSH